MEGKNMMDIRKVESDASNIISLLPSHSIMA